MPTSGVHRTCQRMEVASPAGVVYGLIADAGRWPIFFPHHIHVEQLAFDGGVQRLRMWVSAAGEIRSWHLVRSLDAVRRRVEFRLELQAEPVSAVVGSWSVEPLGSGRARVALRHHFFVAGDAADDIAWVVRAMDDTSRVELAQLKSLAARWTRPAEHPEDARLLALAVAEGLEELPPGQRQVIVLRYYADLPVKDIAEAMGIPEGTVKSRLHGAAAVLRTRLREREVG